MTAQQLKNSILQMAVQGKLVPQDPNDEPASVLLERIREEKAQLIKEGKIKKEKNPSRIFRGTDNLPYEQVGKNEPICIADEVPFEIPDSWEWVRLKDIAIINPRNDVPDDMDAAFMPMPLLMDGYRNEHSYEVKKWREIKNGFTHFAENDIVVAKITPCFQNRKSAILKNLPNGIGAGTTELHVVRRVSCNINNEYLLWIFKSAYFIDNGVKAFSGTAGQQRVGKPYMDSLLIPLPPIDEQNRIVEKIREVMPFCSEYEKAYETIEHLNKTFPDQLKKSILQWAVQGKLVPQDPSDEPASVLLERIRAEKEQLIKAGKIKRDKHESVIFRRDNSHYEKLDGIERCIDDEIPFEIPESWEWVRLGNIGDWGSGATPSRTHPEYYGGNIPWLKTGDLNDGYIDDIPETITELGLAKSSVRLNPVGSVLIAMYGATIGKLGILNIEATTNQACCACFPLGGLSKEYLFYYLMSQKQSFIKQGEGGAQPNISKEKIVQNLMPVPPLEEQYRIVEKIKELLSMVKVL